MADDPKPPLRLVSDRTKGKDFDSFDRALAPCQARLAQRRRPHTLPSGINYALKLPLASGTGECLSLVFESVFRGRSAPR